MQQHPASLGVAEEPVAEPLALMGAFDKAGNVGHDKLVAIGGDHAEDRVQCGERIIGDFRRRAAHRGQEGRFAGVRQTHQPGIGDQLEAQPQPRLFAGPAGIGAARRLVGRAFKLGAAAAAIAAIGAAESDVLLAAERNAAVTAAAGADVNFRLVEKFHRTAVPRLKTGRPVAQPPRTKPGLAAAVLGRWLDRHEGTPGAAARKGDTALDQGKQRMVLAHADIVARVELGAALAHDDVAGDHGFAAILFDAEAPASRVAAVA